MGTSSSSKKEDKKFKKRDKFENIKSDYILIELFNNLKEKKLLEFVK